MATKDEIKKNLVNAGKALKQKLTAVPGQNWCAARMRELS